MSDRVDDWSIFVSVATRRSFADAARASGRSPQVVTRAVAALERRLGTRLLHRTTRSVSLTDAGARLLARARPLLADFEALEAREAGELRGVVTIAAPAMFGQLRVAPVVHEFLRAEPSVDVRLFLQDRVVSLAEEGIDVAVRIGALPDSSLRARHVADVRYVLVAAPAYLAGRGAPTSPRELADHDVVAFTGTSPIPDRWTFRRAGRPEASVSVRPRLVTDSAPAAIDAVVAGLGIARMFSYQVEDLVRERKLAMALDDLDAARIPVNLVQLPSGATRAAAAFVDFAAARMSNRRRRSCVSSRA
ncbi:MAG TPA: LysR family transcriptional regulator [Labilithrix sp.]